MNFSAFFQRPWLWLGAIGLVLLGVLACWHVLRPTDATGNSLILSRQATRDIHRDLAQQAARRQADSLRAARAGTAAAVRYQQGQGYEAEARRLQQQVQDTGAVAGDTATGRLRRELLDY